MDGMEHQAVDLRAAQNQDLVWDLASLARREMAERFIRLFENRLCVYSESVEQLYTNYSLHFPSDLGRKMVVLPNAYAFHDTLHKIEAVAVRKTDLCVVPGSLLQRKGLLLGRLTVDGVLSPKTLPFKQALAQIITNQKKLGDAFLPIMMKGDLREFDQRMPYIHLHRLQVQKLTRISAFERDDIQSSITRKLLELYRLSDGLAC
ncbi:hypothetical protein JQX08_14880 [Pseudomonas sp. UL073]|uniref:Uncharacterized protein n=1 Tax=Zestomonas insulae TaxID=2809017 RepID=A0ABS2II56_9GAMM|nr:hypothetical protein [Pseudomonas insulae]MBM7061994.1 hypothetical protein [Pseudomonas insulae]